MLHRVAAVGARGEHRVVRFAHGRHGGGIGRVVLVLVRAVIPADKPVARRGRRRRGDGRPRQLRRLCLAHRAIGLARNRGGRHNAVGIHIAHLELHSRHKARVVGRVAGHDIGEGQAVRGHHAVGNLHIFAVLNLVPALKGIVLRGLAGRAGDRRTRAHLIAGVIQHRDVCALRHLDPVAVFVGDLADIPLLGCTGEAGLIGLHIALAHNVAQRILGGHQVPVRVVPALEFKAGIGRCRHGHGILHLCEVAPADAVALGRLQCCRLQHGFSVLVRCLDGYVNIAAFTGTLIDAFVLEHRCVRLPPPPLGDEGQA